MMVGWGVFCCSGGRGMDFEELRDEASAMTFAALINVTLTGEASVSSKRFQRRAELGHVIMAVDISPRAWFTACSSKRDPGGGDRQHAQPARPPGTATKVGTGACSAYQIRLFLPRLARDCFTYIADDQRGCLACSGKHREPKHHVGAGFSPDKVVRRRSIGRFFMRRFSLRNSADEAAAVPGQDVIWSGKFAHDERASRPGLCASP